MEINDNIKTKTLLISMGHPLISISRSDWRNRSRSTRKRRSDVCDQSSVVYAFSFILAGVKTAIVLSTFEVKKQLLYCGLNMILRQKNVYTNWKKLLFSLWKWPLKIVNESASGMALIIPKNVLLSFKKWSFWIAKDIPQTK